MTTAATAHAAPLRGTAQSWRLIAAASIGNALEWFDLLVYGYFAVTMSTVFTRTA